MKLVILILVAALIIFHQDFWNWDSDQLYFGFMPIGLLYHVGISLACSLVWLIVCTFCWPPGVDDFEDESLDIANRASKDGGQA